MPTTVTNGPATTTTDAAGNTVTSYMTTVTIPAPAVGVTPPVVVTPPPVQNAALSAVALGKNGAMNGFLPLCTPEFNTDISKFPVDTKRDAAFKKEYTVPEGDHFHFDPTMPYFVVQNAPTVKLTSIQYADESDTVPVPITATTPTEGGGMIGATVNGKKITASGDHHTIILDKGTGKLFELYQTAIDAKGNFSAASETVWDITKTYRRTPGFTSADAAGLPILPLLIKYDEAAAGPLKHACRVTFGQLGGTILKPATHTPNPQGGDSALPGMLLRMKAMTDISKCAPIVQNILKGWMTYGIYVADQGGNNYVSANDDPRWDADTMSQLSQFTELDLEVVDTSSFQ